MIQKALIIDLSNQAIQDFWVKYQESSIRFENPAYLQSIENKCKIRHSVNPNTLKLLYYSLLYSFICYGVSVWGLRHPSILDPLIKLQKRVAQAITFQDKYAHSTSLFHQLKMLKLFDVHSLQLQLHFVSFMIALKVSHF